MDVLTQNALPLVGIMLPVFIMLRLEFVKKRKLLWGGIALGLNIAMIIFLAAAGAGIPEILLMLLISLLVCAA